MWLVLERRVYSGLRAPSIREVGDNGTEEYAYIYIPPSYCYLMNSECHMKVNPNRKKENTLVLELAASDRVQKQ